MRDAIWIVVLTYNGWQDTRACLQSVFADARANFKVMVVDNGSTDETLDALAREFPQVQVQVNASNLGYAEGNNAGLRYAMAHGAEFVVILNNDVIVARDWLEHLLNAARANERAALLGPFVYHADEKNIIQSAGGLIDANWRASHRGQNETDNGQFADTARVDWLTGCAIMARTAALEKIGLLDASFFMYGEDVDWGIRARRAGYDVLVVPQAHVWHKGVQRNYAPAPHVTYYTARNELRLIRKHRGGTRAFFKTWLRHARTASSWTLLPRWKSKRAHRDALLRALRDDLRGVSGPMRLG